MCISTYLGSVLAEMPVIHCEPMFKGLIKTRGTITSNTGSTLRLGS